MLEPATPKADEYGRLTTSSPLRPGWPCRWCSHPLSFVLNHQAGTAAGVLGCCHCDNPGKTTGICGGNSARLWGACDSAPGHDGPHTWPLIPPRITGGTE